jgi:hypothetical protein
LIESGAEIHMSSNDEESFTSSCTSNEDGESAKPPTHERMKKLILENIADFVQMDLT